MAFPTHQLADVVKIAPVVLAKELLMPVPEVFHQVLPGTGLQRGWTTHVAGSASGGVFAWAMLSEVTRSGGWVAAVDIPGISLAAASEVGVSVERVLVISGVDAQSWAATMGALIGSVDAVIYGAPRHRIQPSAHRKLVSRCRERGTVLMQLTCGHSTRQSSPPPVEADISFEVQPVRWAGLGKGYGRLESRTISVSVSGRRAQGRVRRGTFMLPDVDGSVRHMPEIVDPVLSIVS